MTFPERTRSECAVLACCGVMVPETSLRLPVQINWWNPPSISLGQFFRWSRNNSARLHRPWRATRRYHTRLFSAAARLPHQAAESRMCI